MDRRHGQAAVLTDGCDDAAYLAALDAALDQLWRRHGATPPGLVFYLAGADPHEGDRLGRLKLTPAGLLERDRRVFAACRERGIPVAISMAGGYGRDIADSVTVHENTLREAVAWWRIGMEQCADDAARRAAPSAAIPLGGTARSA